MAANDEDLALQLHKQLNAIPLRTRRGHGPELAHQPSLDRKRDRGAAKPRSKRTNSSSQDHPDGKKQRTSDPDDHGHTSSRHRPIKRDPEDSDHSQHGGSDHDDHKNGVGKGCDSRDSGMAAAEDGQRQLALMREPDPLQLLQECSHPLLAAAAFASHRAKQQAMQDVQTAGQVKVFYAGVRWALSLPPSAVKSRQELAKALNDAFVGEILSVGQGEGLTVVFVDSNGTTAEVGPTKRSSSRTPSARWRTLAKTAARIYVR